MLSLSRLFSKAPRKLFGLKWFVFLICVVYEPGPTILDATLGAVGQGIIGLAGPAVQPLVDVMNNWFNTYSPGLTEFTGSLSPYDVFNGNAFDNYGTDTGKGRIGLLKSFEIF